MELTKDADKLICCLYKDYLKQIKNGVTKFDAKCFEFSQIQSYKPLANISIPDLKETIAEASRAGFGDMTFEGNFYANDKFIIYMENRFKNGLSEVADFISKFIP